MSAPISALAVKLWEDLDMTINQINTMTWQQLEDHQFSDTAKLKKYLTHRGDFAKKIEFADYILSF